MASPASKGLKGALAGWIGSSQGGFGLSMRNISLTRYPENWLEGIYWARQRAKAAIPKTRTPAPAIDRRDIVPVPVGTPRVKRGTEKPSGAIVPSMVLSPNLRGAPPGITVARGAAIPQKEPSIPILPTKAPNMGLDLGNLLNTGLEVYKELLAIKNPLPAPIPQFSPLDNSMEIFKEGWDTAKNLNFGMPQPAPPPVTPGGAMEAPTDDKGWVYKKVCGEWKWIKPKRRRRRKLLTDSDFNSLLKLQTLKVNSNMNIAIAKSIGR